MTFCPNKWQRISLKSLPRDRMVITVHRVTCNVSGSLFGDEFGPISILHEVHRCEIAIKALRQKWRQVEVFTVLQYSATLIGS